MITLTTDFNAAASSKQIVSDFLLEVNYDDTTPGTLYFSTQNRKVTNQYHGSVLDWGTIQETIDLSKSRAAIADMKIKLGNVFPNATGRLSDELLGTSKIFINQDVTIRSWLVGCNTTGDCLIRYTGRIVDIKHDTETVTLVIEARSPWDRVTAISDVVDDALAGDGLNLPEVAIGQVKPVVYGDLTYDFGRATTAMTARRDSLVVPMVYLGLTSANEQKWLISDHELEDDPDYLDLWGFDEVLGRYVGLLIGGGGITIVQNSSTGCIISFDPTDVTFQDILFGDGTVSGEANTGSGDWANDTDANNADADDYASSSFDSAESLGDKSIIDIDFDPNYAPERTINGVEWYGKLYHARGASLAQGDEYFLIGLNNMNYIAEDAVWAGLIAIVPSGDETDMQASITMTHYKDDVGGGTDAEARVYEIWKRGWYKTTDFIQMNFAGKGQEFCRWTGGTAIAADYPHRIFRDLLKVWAGWDATGIDYVEVNGTDWSGSSVDTDRNWGLKWYGNEKTPLKDLLDQLQFEGCFIWLFDQTSSGIEARVVYTTGSVVVDDTLDGSNLSSVKFSHTPVSAIVSTRIANYSRQTLSGEYRFQNTKVNSSRSSWNFATEENIVENNLDWLQTSSDVDEFLAYYDNIVGQPKLIISAVVDHPKHWGLQVGDKIKFTNLEVNPFGWSAYTAFIFMITKTEISPTKFKITATHVNTEI